MPTEISTTSTGQRRIGAGFVFLCMAGGLLAVLLLIAGWVWLGSHRQLAAELERLRASGEPASVEEIEAFYEVPPDGRDATKIWLNALAPLDTPRFKADGKHLPFVGENTEAVPLPGEPWPQLDEAEQLLSKYQRSLDGMHRAARLGGQARFTTNFADGVGMLLPHLQQLRAGARLLTLETVVHAHRGQTDAALESIDALFAAARSLEGEPILVSQLVRMALDEVARERIALLLEAGILDGGQLASLDAQLAACDFNQGFRRALMAERVIGLQTFADPASLGREIAGARWGLIPSGDQAMFLQIMREVLVAAKDSSAAMRDAAFEAEDRVRQLRGTAGWRLRYPLTALLVPSLGAFAQALTRREAERDATRVALAIERFRRSQGRVPQNLDELVPEFLPALLLDPFDGAPLRYRATATEYVVYSIGPNGGDDGGSSEPPDRPADLVVRVPLKNLLTP